LLGAVQQFASGIPYLMFFVWYGLFAYEQIRANTKLTALQVKYDPHGSFIYRTLPPSNYYRVDRKHPDCSEEFLAQWDYEYGLHWWRVAGLLVLMGVFGQTGELARDFLRGMQQR